jgi:rhamnulokinase
MARGRIGGLSDARAIIARSFPVTIFEPRDSAAWDEAATRFSAILDQPR